MLNVISMTYNLYLCTQYQAKVILLVQYS